MSTIKVLKPRCSSCDCRFTYTEVLSKREGGVNLQFGREYCKGSKKYRAFRKNDPKTYPPDWCPKKKCPSEFRIYALKDSDAWFFRLLTGSKSAPMGYQCAVRETGTVELAPYQFFRDCEDTSVSELLGTTVNSGEIVEIDDGLKPYFFYVTFNEVEVLSYWNVEQARANTYQESEDKVPASDKGN